MLDPMFCLLTMDIGDDTQRLLCTRSLLLFHYRLWGRDRWGVQNRLECIGGTSTLALYRLHDKRLLRLPDMETER